MLRGWLPVEEQNVGFDAAGIEDPGRQTKKGVNIALLEKAAAHRLSRPIIEQNVVGNHDRGATVDIEQAIARVAES